MSADVKIFGSLYRSNCFAMELGVLAPQVKKKGEVC